MTIASDSSGLALARTISQDTTISLTDDMASVNLKEGTTALQTRTDQQSKTLVESAHGPLTRQACRYDCFCECHSQAVHAPRKSLSKLKRATSSCTEQKCRGNEIHAKRNNASLGAFQKFMTQVGFSKSIKVRYELNTYRMVPEGAEAMRYVKHGQLSKLQSSIENGVATLYDTAPDGWSLLHVCSIPK
jgi:hypothetical protein